MEKVLEKDIAKDFNLDFYLKYILALGLLFMGAAKFISYSALFNFTASALTFEHISACVLFSRGTWVMSNE